ncbi:uncharacterized mitochondrial protein-like protein [Tanacetum coccineum]
MNYKPVVAGNQSNGSAGTKVCDDAGKARVEIVLGKDYILLPLWTQDPPFSSSSKDSPNAGFKPSGDNEKKVTEDLGNEDSEVPSTEVPRVNQEKDANVNNTNNINTVSPIDNVAGIEDNVVDEIIVYGCADDLNIVYKVEKALYGLHQAPRAWYETLSTYLLDNGFQSDDIVFGSTKKVLCTEFKKLMHKKFQMSSMASTPMETSKPLMKDGNAKDVDVQLYRSMIGSLMYLTSSRPDIMFVVCACARFQVTPKVSHLHAVKRIFRYLKGQPKLGLWYPKDSPFDLEAYTDSDYASSSLDKKSTTGGCQFLGSRLISWQCKKQTVVANSTTEAEYVAASNCCGQSSEPTNLDTDEVVHEERGDSMERDATPATSGSPRCQEAMGDTIAQTRSERVSTPSYDSPLLGVNTPRNDEERIKLKELMDMWVLDLENVKDAQALEIKKLKKRVKKLEKRESSKKTPTKEECTSCTAGVSTLMEMRSVNIKRQSMEKRVVSNKGKGIMQELEKPVKVKGKDQIEYDADVAQRLQAELDEEVRLKREREEEVSNDVLIEEWDSIEARIDADAQLAERLQA